MPLWWGFNFQNMTSEISFYLDYFHDFILGLLIFILLTVLGVLFNLFISKSMVKSFFDSFSLEFIWTLYPIFILILIGIPSMRILYLHEVEDQEGLTMKITGHQWYWTIDYCDFKDLEFDMFMKPMNEMELGEFRLLDVDNRSVLPLNMNTRFMILSADVLHSWTIPNFGLKVDANPGRLNLVHFTPFKNLNNNPTKIKIKQMMSEMKVTNKIMFICFYITFYIKNKYTLYTKKHMLTFYLQNKYTYYIKWKILLFEIKNSFLKI